MITDELRDCIRTANRSYEDARNPYNDREILHIPEEELLAIADRIDIAHKHAIGYVDDRDPETMAENGWVRLPKDADGEYIHIGDVMEGVDKYDTLKKVKGKVITVSFESDGAVDVAVQAWNSDGKSWHRAYLDPDASVYRHHHAPTVEDVLREFADRVCNSGHQWGLDAADTIAEYAAKLRLTGDAA